MTPQYLTQFFEGLGKLKALVIGDAMLDAYYFGAVTRISPEAPVPIVDIQHREMRLGGAANVLLNLQALGIKPYLATVIGQGNTGKNFLQLLQDANLATDAVIVSPERITTQKTRIIAQNQQMLRVDEEYRHNITSEEQNLLFDSIKSLILTESINFIILEDYDKGVLGPDLIGKIVSLAKQNNIIIAVDPKKANFLNYPDVDIFKPNLKELREGLNITLKEINVEQLDKATDLLKAKMPHRMTMITLGAHGLYFNTGNKSIMIPAHLRKISDVSGAGDTVISVAAACLSLGLSTEIVAEMANLAGGLVCEDVGVVPIQKDKLFDEALKLGLFAK